METNASLSNSFRRLRLSDQHSKKTQKIHKYRHIAASAWSKTAASEPRRWVTASTHNLTTTL